MTQKKQPTLKYVGDSRSIIIAAPGVEDRRLMRGDEQEVPQAIADAVADREDVLNMDEPKRKKGDGDGDSVES